MKSALRDALQNGMRVTQVEAEYLARQGVLVSVTLNAPWLIVHKGSPDFQVEGRHIVIPEIPAMVENILHDLKIDIAPYEPEALEELRELRSEQRELRLEQRDIRAQLRSKRRDLVREEDAERRDIERDIEALERELASVDAQYNALAQDIEAQYEHLRDQRNGRDNQKGTPEDPDLDQLIARTVCDYGGTLNSLDTDHYLTVALHRGEQTSYYAFNMAHVKQCSSRDLEPGRLLELAYQYNG